MKRNVFKLLKSDDEKILDRLSEHAALSEREKDRIFKLSEKKLESMKNGAAPDINAEREKIDIVSVQPAPRWLAVCRSAAACLIVAAIGAGAFGIIHTQEPNVTSADDASEVEEIKIADTDSAAASSGEEDAPEQQTDEEKRKKGCFTGDESAAEIVSVSSAASSSKKKIVSSAADESERTNDAEVSSAACVASAAVSQIIDTVPVTTIENGGEEQYSEGENISAYEDTTVSAAHEGESIGDESRQSTASDRDIAETDPMDTIGETSSELVMKVTADMTYAQVFDFLGIPDTFGQDYGYAQYIVDDENLLMLWFDNEKDIIGADGLELLEAVYPNGDDQSYAMCPIGDLKSYRDGENFVFDAYVVNPDSLLVTCPQDGLHCATVVPAGGVDSFIKEYQLKRGNLIRIEYDGTVAESYPPIIYLQNDNLIQLFKY